MKTILKRGVIALFFGVVGLTVEGQVITTVAGCGTCSALGDGGPATAASINYFGFVSTDKYGNMIIADDNNHRIRRVDANTGIISTIAGTGIAGFSGDGSHATSANLNHPIWLAVDTAGNIYFTDGDNDRIRRIDVATNIITTVAGNGIATFGGDGGPATAASISNPQGICFDKYLNLYICDGGNKRVRKVTPLGIITTFAGNGIIGSGGDGVPATSAELFGLYGICADTSGNVFIADQNDNKIRKVDAITGVISTVAGDGTYAFSGDGGPATAAQLKWPKSVSVSKSGGLYIADQVNDRIRKVNLSTGIIETVAGNGITGFGGDGGTPLTASLNRPCGVSLDYCGNLLIADKMNRRVRKVTFYPYSTPTVVVTGMAVAMVGATVTVSATVSGTAGSYNIKWFKNSSLLSITTAPTVTYTKGAGTDTITARVVPAVSYCSDSATSAPHLVTASGVGVNDVIADIGLVVYPSPAGAVLHVSAAVELKHIEVTNLLGQRVIDAAGSSTLQELDVSPLPQGVYLVRVNDAWVRRFVKE